MGQMGENNADMGDSTVAWIKSQLPDLQPKRILDMGCAVGHSTVPYATGFPGAEVHAIDVAAPMLRYGHARANAMGASVHFSQQNAEHTDFEDNSFDLVVSHILLHETSSSAIRNVIAECHRVLKPGGWMLHVETPPYEGMSPFDTFLFDWDSENNNEPFWRKSHMLDLDQLAHDAGFAQDPIKVMVPSSFQETQRSMTFQGGDFGGGGVWFVYGCQK
jgi:ubiquinone/menaquinone biosynthesis C-methylase UbiE